MKIKTDKSFINPEGKSLFAKNNHSKLADDIVNTNPVYKKLIRQDETSSTFLINIGYILVDDGINKMIIYRSDSLNDKSKNRLLKLIKKYERYHDSIINDAFEDESEEEHVRIRELIKKIRELEKSNETNLVGGQHGR